MDELTKDLTKFSLFMLTLAIVGIAFVRWERTIDAVCDLKYTNHLPMHEDSVKLVTDAECGPWFKGKLIERGKSSK